LPAEDLLRPVLLRFAVPFLAARLFAALISGAERQGPLRQAGSVRWPVRLDKSRHIAYDPSKDGVSPVMGTGHVSIYF
jgi:hypothetical protein